MIAGVDGCKGKWIAVVDMGNGRTQIWEPCTFLELYDNFEIELIVIDIPIGLPEKGDRCAYKGTRNSLQTGRYCVSGTHKATPEL
jgi:predicted RNase H-like nuclease